MDRDHSRSLAFWKEVSLALGTLAKAVPWWWWWWWGSQEGEEGTTGREHKLVLEENALGKDRSQRVPGGVQGAVCLGLPMWMVQEGQGRFGGLLVV